MRKNIHIYTLDIQKNSINLFAIYGSYRVQKTEIIKKKVSILHFSSISLTVYSIN